MRDHQKLAPERSTHETEASVVLHCLGTTGFHPSPSRHTACYYLPDWSLMLDAGTGMFRLVQYLLQQPQRSIDILLSHAHLDHTVGLTFLIDALAVTQLEHVRLFGDPQKLDAVRTHLFSRLIFPVAPVFEFVALDDSAPRSSEDGSGPVSRLDCSSSALGRLDAGSLVDPEIQVTFFPLEHPGGSLGFLIERRGKRLAYVTDTVVRSPSTSESQTRQSISAADLAELLQGVDLLMHECYFNDQQQPLAEKTGHSWLSAVTDFVRATCPKQTLLIHINPLAEILGNDVELAEEHQELNMRFAEDEMRVLF